MTYGETCYSRMKNIIGRLEDDMEKIEKEEISESDLDILCQNVERAWSLLCRRKEATNHRGPYERRSTRKA